MNWIRTISAACLLVFSACSSYDARWNKAREAKTGGDSYSGAYEGTWRSERYGAGGKLWCILNKKSEREYNADFKATWHGLFSSTHSVVLKAAGAKGGKLRFNGESTISMWIGSGTYRCDGQIVRGEVQDCTGQKHRAVKPRTLVPTRMTAKYDAGIDQGTMDLVKRLE